MFKLHGFKYFICLSTSISINIFLLYLFLRREPQLTWTKEAALEAEAVASISCSGHGQAFIDGSTSDGKPVCECYSCYKGFDCSQFSPDCPADADGGDPLFLEPFWKQNAAASSAVLVAGWHRMSYSMADGSSISVELKKLLLQFHEAAGNAITADRFIIFGDGSTQLLNAAVYALAEDGLSFPASVVARVPCYGAYPIQTKFFKTEEYEWEGDASNWKNATDPSNFIEFVTSPNNPDGLLRRPTIRVSSLKTINDHAYYWPHFTAIPAPADEDVMLFSISKATGHAGSRFGWALIKNENVYKRMSRYTSLNTMGVSHDTQLRTFKFLKAALKDGGRGLFELGHKTMSDRWRRLNTVVSMSRRFSLQKISPLYCSYFKKNRDPSPAYGWLKCEREEEKNCHGVLKAAGIISRDGTIFGADTRYVRLSLIKSQDDFDWLLQKLKALVEEVPAKSI